MATGKKYFWIKLKTDFMTSDKVDYLMSQTNGAEYVVLYQMLCMKCINTDGLLARQIGEVIIPFDAEKIARDCKYFSVDTVKQAFQLFIQLGMIYQETNGYLRIADFENMVGSETDWAAQKRKQVKSKENPAIECGESVETSVENLHTEIEIRDRDKILDINNIYEKTPEENAPINPFILKSGGTWFLNKTLYDSYKNTFTNINVDFELKKMQTWLMSNPSKRKTEKGMPKFINNWLSNAKGYELQSVNQKPKGLENKISLEEWDGE